MNDTHNNKERAESQAPIRLAYLVSRYPAVSHTFILREVLRLRELGFEITVASINPPDQPPEKLTAAEHDHLGTRRLLRAFPDMKSLNYADTLAATRAAMLRLRELAAAAKDAARETAANAKEKIKKA